MAKRPLKVYGSQIGFYDVIIAAPNQASALKAWGVRQNLFASGDAAVVDDNDVAAQARRHPEVILRRPIGETGPFEQEPREKPKLSKSTSTTVERAKAAGRKKTPKPPPDRGPLEAAETSLQALDKKRSEEVEALLDQQSELRSAISAARKTYQRDRKVAAQAVADARKAFRKAGGDPTTHR